MIAIHLSESGFSKDWVEYCESNNINYKLVDCYSSNIISDLHTCTALMWNWYHDDYKAQLFARQLTFSLEQSGIICFPSAQDCWHYDDKLGQKYLFEALGVSSVNSGVFYSKKDALTALDKLKLPIVLKTRGGAGSSNVQLIRSKREYRKVAQKCFGNGLAVINRISFLRDALTNFLRVRSKSAGMRFIRALYRSFVSTSYEKFYPRQNGYMYYQEFIDNNEFDIRVIIIDGKAFAIKRHCRDGDFRASGSGVIEYEKSAIDEKYIKAAYNANIKLDSDCVAFDFVQNSDGTPLVVEVSYAFSKEAYFQCPGYWDSNLNWNAGSFNAQHWMVEAVLKKTKKLG